MLALVGSLAASVAVAGCTNAGASGSPGSGSSGSPGASIPVPSATPGYARVSGRSTAGPTCPVERNPPDPSCAPRSVSGAVLVVQNAAGAQLLRITTGSDGSFSFSVAPGAIRIVPQPVAGLLGTAPPVDLQVAANAVITSVVIDYDTGIR